MQRWSRVEALTMVFVRSWLPCMVKEACWLVDSTAIPLLLLAPSCCLHVLQSVSHNIEQVIPYLDHCPLFLMKAMQLQTSPML